MPPKKEKAAAPPSTASSRPKRGASSPDGPNEAPSTPKRARTASGAAAAKPASTTTAGTSTPRGGRKANGTGKNKDKINEEEHQAAEDDMEVDNANANGSGSTKNGNSDTSKAKAKPQVKGKPQNKVLEGLKNADGGAGGDKKRRGSERSNATNGSGVRRIARENLGRMAFPKKFPALRPPRTALVCGTGDNGGFGCGPDEQGEKGKPEMHTWIEEGIEDGKFGDEGAGIEDIICGGMHSLMIDEKGRVWSWGVNDGGALGRRTANIPDPANPGQMLNANDLESIPTLVTGLEEEGFRAVRAAAGDSVSLVISDEGKVKYWGSFRDSQGGIRFPSSRGANEPDRPERRGTGQFEAVDLPSNGNRLETDRYIDAACGADHVLALSADGYVYAFGDGEKFQLGRKVMARRPSNAMIPEKVSLKNIVAVGAGAYHSLAIDQDGHVYGWGNNAFGQLGIEEEDIKPNWDVGIVQQPTRIKSLSPEHHGGVKVKKVVAGENHSLFLFENGELWTCGKTVDGEAGLAADHPAMTEQVLLQQSVKTPAQIFFPPPSTPDNRTPGLEPYKDTDAYRQASARVLDVEAKSRHSLAITTDGFYYSWGGGPSSELGLGTVKTVAETPTLLTTKFLRSHTGLKAALGSEVTFVLVQARDTPWGQ